MARIDGRALERIGNVHTGVTKEMMRTTTNGPALERIENVQTVEKDFRAVGGAAQRAPNMPEIA